MTKSNVLGASAVVTAAVLLAVTGLAKAAPNSSSAPGVPGEQAV